MSFSIDECSISFDAVCAVFLFHKSHVITKNPKVTSGVQLLLLLFTEPQTNVSTLLVVSRFITVSSYNIHKKVTVSCSR